jgi:preprotein translocase subunit YajC
VGILILILPLIALWFFLIRPQQQRAKERQAMVARLKVGDEVATAGGLIGVVTELALDDDPEVLLIEVAQGVEVGVLRRGIADVRYVEGDDDLGAGLLSPGAAEPDALAEGMEAADAEDDPGEDETNTGGDE